MLCRKRGSQLSAPDSWQPGSPPTSLPSHPTGRGKDAPLPRKPYLDSDIAVGPQGRVTEAAGRVLPDQPLEGLAGPGPEAPQKFQQLQAGAQTAVTVHQSPEEQRPNCHHEPVGDARPRRSGGSRHPTVQAAAAPSSRPPPSATARWALPAGGQRGGRNQQHHRSSSSGSRVNGGARTTPAGGGRGREARLPHTRLLRGGGSPAVAGELLRQAGAAGLHHTEQLL